jgi:2-amino-4-hydroxy-6-hydroxymethyldihydropteridine diphosphokinase
MAYVFVSIGSNIEREDNIRSGVRALYQTFGPLQLSSVYDSEAVGFDGDAFYNLVAGFDTDRDIQQVVACLHDIEDRHQRRRDGPRFSSRTLDIDLLLYDDLVLDGPDLSLPRAEIMHSAFVLAPLAEIAGTRRHPLSGVPYAELWQQFDRDSQPMTRLKNFLWDQATAAAGSFNS